MRNIALKFIGLFAFASVALAASAENWYLKKSIGDGIFPFSTNVSDYWTNSLGAAASSIGSDDECFIDKGLTYTRYENDSFPGAKLHLGSADGATTGTLTFRDKTFAVPLYWHSGTVKTGFSNRTAGFVAANSALYLDLPVKTHALQAGSSGTTFVIPALHCADADLVLKLSTASSKTDYVFLFKGDNADYKGSVSLAAGTSVLVAGTANALGDPTTARADALTVDLANSVFAVLKDVSLNTARGITINKDGFAIRADVIAYSGGSATSTWSHDCSSFELNMPIAGAYGFSKTGSGTVTLGGAYTAGAITVSTGTLVIASSATFPAQQAVTVKSGATFEVHQSLANFAITQEDGATVRRVVDPIVVSYDPDAKTVTTVVKTAFDIPAGQVQEVRLSNPIALPSHDALDLEVLRVAPGSADLSASDFTDATAKTFELPRTSFRVVKDEDGTQHIWLTARPVVTSVAYIGTIGINGSAESWSDAAMPHTGADYLLTNSVGSIKKYAFGGDNLTIAGGVTLQFRYENSSGIGRFETKSGNPVIIYPGVKTSQGYSGTDQSAQGAIELPGAYGDEDYFDAYLKYGKTASNQGTFNVTADLSGAGTLQIRGAKNGTSWHGLGGNNTNYFGRIVMTGNGTTVEDRGVQVRVSRPESFGGRLAEFHEDAVTLTDYAMIKATADVALANDANRGLLVSGTGGFNCDSGKVFACGWPVRLDGTMYKLGLGALQLGGALTHGTGSTSNLIVRAGEVEALSDAAVAGLTVVTTNDLTIVVPAGLSAGFAGLQLSGDARPKVHVRFDSASAAGENPVETAICTVPAASGVSASDFVVDRAGRYACELVETSLEGDVKRYSLRCVARGAILIVR